MSGKREFDVALDSMREAVVAVQVGLDYARGFADAKKQALWWCQEMAKADGNVDWQEACVALEEAIESKVWPCATEER